MPKAAWYLAIAIVALVAVNVTVVPPSAQSVPPPRPITSPTVDEILAKYEQALGGAANAAKITTRMTKTRRFQDYGAPEDHDLYRWTKRPANANARILSIMRHDSLDGQFLRWSNGCDGKTGWNWSGRNDPSGKPIDDHTIDGGLCEHRLAYYGYFPLDLARMKRNYQRFELKGMKTIFQPAAMPVGALAGGKGADIVPAGTARETYLVLGAPHKGDGWHWLYFDTQTGLLLRMTDAGEGSAPIPAGNTARIVDFLQFRQVGNGTIAPFQFVNQGPETRVRGVHVDMQDNVPMDDKMFVKPPNSLREDKGLGS
jgi:hypothetical protein